MSYIARSKEKVAGVVVISVVAGLTIGDQALAADPQVIDVAPDDAPLLDLEISPGFGFGPDYEGSNDYETYFFYDLVLSWREMIEISYYGDIPPAVPDITDFEIEATLIDNDRYYVGVGLGYLGGRDEDDNDALDGLGDIDDSIAGNVFGDVTLAGLTYGADFTGDLGGEIDGYAIDFSVGSDFEWWDDDLEIEVDTILTWASENYADAFFGVSAEQAADSGLGEQDAGAGFKSVGVEFELNYELGDRWEFGFDLGYARLIGDAADSDIVAVEGDPNQFEGELYLTRNFVLWN